VTINTDNRLITDTTVSKELWLCHTQMGMSVEDLKHVVLNGFKATFLPFHTKQAWVRRIGKELAQLPNENEAGEPASA